MAVNLRQIRDLITISRLLEDGEYEVLDNMYYVHDGCHYYVFIGQKEDPHEYYLKFDFQRINILDENDNIVNCRLPDESISIIHVKLCVDGWNFLRNILREERRFGIVYDSEDEYSDAENDRYERMSDLEAVENYLSVVGNNGNVDIIIHSEDEDSDE